MRLLMVAAGALAVMVGFAALGRAQPDDSAKERKALQGTWQAVRIEFDGATAPEEVIKKVRWVFQGEQYTGISPETQFKGSYTLNPAKTLKEIDLMPANGKERMQAIYKIEGDQLTLCIGQPRPSDFTTAEESNRRLYVLKRIKP